MKWLVSLRTFRRPAYLQEALDSWRRANQIEQAKFIFNIDSDDPDVARVARNFDACETEIVVNPEHLGGPVNAFTSFERGFEQAEFVITAEEDVIVSEDILDFFEYGQRYREDPNVFCICSFQGENDGCGKVHLDDWFTQPSPTGFWIDRWESEIRGTWDRAYAAKGWDHNLNDNIIQGRLVVKPCMSRSQHIGEFGGLHCLPGEMFQRLRAPNFTPGPHPGGFRE